MKTSENGIALIKRWEGLELQSYQDIAGVWTIGYGHTETAGPDQKISEREAEQLLQRDLEPRERAVGDLTSVSLNQNEFDALVSFVYNVGVNAYRNSTARKRLNRGDRVGAAEALAWFNKATVGGVLREVTGLTRRRAAERGLFLTPTNPPIVADPKKVSENTRITPIEDTPRRESLGDSRTVQGAVVAGGAGAAASTIGRESAEDLDQLERNIEQGTGLTEKLPGEGGLGDPTAPGGAGDAPGPDGPPTDETPGASTDNSDAAGDGAAEDAPADGGLSSDAPAVDAPATGDAPTGDAPTGDAPADSGTVQTIEVGPPRPSAREKNAVDAQLQLALLIIILLSALYVIFARVDDWWKYRR
ncbi:MAG: glycoside hydrolase family protein [Parvularculaceae bacterium]|nr:glycoside hydrolase family protein [Parvularculaceae bacterium]